MLERTILEILKNNNVDESVRSKIKDVFAADAITLDKRNPTYVEGLSTVLNQTIHDPPSSTHGNSPKASPEVEAETIERAKIGRYYNLGFLGKGGMGEVIKIFDDELNRTLAMKVIHPWLMKNSNAVSRFVEEGQICAQLEHPNIVPVYEIGCLNDKRLYFTMKQIKGRDFTNPISDVHHSIKNGRWFPTGDGWSFRRLLDVFYKVCSAVAYAHSKGVVHRDLKPENIMIGAFGEVLVVDWGIAKVMGDKNQRESDLESRSVVTPVVTERSSEKSHKTLIGQVAGTPSYMAPEQAKGEIHKIDFRTDVYALGSILHEILTGEPPYVGLSSEQVLEQVRSGPPRLTLTHRPREKGDDAISALQESTNKYSGPPLPDVLVEACHKALSREPEARFQTVDELTTVLRDWLAGLKSREQALIKVNQAQKIELQRRTLVNKASEHRKEARLGLNSIPVWDSEVLKSPFWKLEEKAEALEIQAEILGVRCEQLLHTALTYKPDIVEAHEVLANQYRQDHEQAELNRNKAKVVKSEQRLLEHVRALPKGNATRRKHFSYLKGLGALSLTTNVEGAEFILERFEENNRRLTPTKTIHLGRGAVFEHPLEKGSYRVLVRKDGFHEVTYPVHVGRGEHWDCVPPEGGAPVAIQMFPLGTFGVDDCYVPAGWFWSGGDMESKLSFPGQRLWIDGFVCRKFPVTNLDYVAFLDDLVRQGREAEALKWVPRESSGQANRQGAIIYGRKKDGTFELVPDGDGDGWLPQQPVCMVNWFCAAAYAEWYALESGSDWRLPFATEWEKAARGVDGRYFPWGDGFNPSFSCMRLSHKIEMLPSEVDSFPVDETVYGVRGMAGNMLDWTASNWHEKGPLIENQRPVETTVRPPLTVSRILRGGAWNLGATSQRLAGQMVNTPGRRSSNYGFRLVKSL